MIILRLSGLPKNSSIRNRLLKNDMLTPTTLVQKKMHSPATRTRPRSRGWLNASAWNYLKCELKYGQVYVWAVQQFDLQERHVPKRSHSNFQIDKLHASFTFAKSTLM